MKLLILTQKVDQNDDVLGFFHRWLVEFSKYCESVTVIALSVGTYNLPSNVRVFSLGKEIRQSRIQYLMRFFSYIIKERSRYDTVFVHMNSEYVVLGGLLWKLWKKKVGLFYTHRQVHLKLRIAEKLSDVIFSASSLSFRIPSKKLRVVGHGIDIAGFTCSSRPLSDRVHILTVGRMTKIKNCDVLVRAAAILSKKWDKKFSVVFVGGPGTPEDIEYEKYIKGLVSELGLTEIVHFVGSVPNKDMKDFYCNADIVVNMTPTGGIDKTVIEAMVSGAMPLVSNRAFKEHFGSYAEALIFKERDHEDLARKIIQAEVRTDRGVASVYLQKVAREKFSVEKLIPKILSLYTK